MNALLSQLMRFSLGTQLWHAAPFSIKVKKTIWSIGTDGCVLLAVKMPGAVLSKGGYPDELVDALKAESKGAVEVDLLQLKEWAGQAPMVLVPDGLVVPEHQGIVLDCVIDKRKLAFLLAKISMSKVLVWHTVGSDFLVFEHPQGQWRAFIARVDAQLDKDMPVFKIEQKPEELSALELAELAATT